MLAMPGAAAGDMGKGPSGCGVWGREEEGVVE